MKKLVFFIFFSSSILFSQEKKYWEDQLFLNITYNTLKTNNKNIKPNIFSYGFSLGYIKDIPLSKKGTWAIGTGIGYGFNYLSYKSKNDSLNNFLLKKNITSNNFFVHNIEFPIQLRWRNSSYSKYKFWRVYTGVRLSYNFANKLNYSISSNEYSFKNIPNYNKFQTGLELSVGYSAFNFYIYYGLTPIYKDLSINDGEISVKNIKFGLIFYLL